MKRVIKTGVVVVEVEGMLISVEILSFSVEDGVSDTVYDVCVISSSSVVGDSNTSGSVIGKDDVYVVGLVSGTSVEVSCEDSSVGDTPMVSPV